jgi:hypothetical protein
MSLFAALRRSISPGVAAPVARFARRRALVASGLVAISALNGCDRVKAAVRSSDEAVGDVVWQRDSTLLEAKPSMLFRVVDFDKSRAVVPIATIGSAGFRRVTMGQRGWRAFDLAYLTSGHTLSGIRHGRVTGKFDMTRGMWEAGTQLDSLPGCPMIIPAGLSNAGNVSLAVSGPPPKLTNVAPLSAGELQTALARIPTLIAPSSGIGTSRLSRYKREVHLLATGATPRPSILVIYNDPEQVSDTLSRMDERPRHFIVLLDKGIYGYRPTYTYATLGNIKSPPRMRFVDFVDVDADGKAEIFFGYLRNNLSESTAMLRYENEKWTEVLNQLLRCQL